METSSMTNYLTMKNDTFYQELYLFFFFFELFNRKKIEAKKNTYSEND